jgi:hypothetical protein
MDHSQNCTRFNEQDGESTLQKTRPIGVTILAALEVVIGLVMVFEGSGLALLGALAGMFTQGLSDLLGALSSILGGVLIAIGILSLFTAFGVWAGKGWAWTVSLVLAVLGLLFGLVIMIGSAVLEIVWIIVFAIMIYYLYRPNVRSFFGKGGA